MCSMHFLQCPQLPVNIRIMPMRVFVSLANVLICFKAFLLTDCKRRRYCFFRGEGLLVGVEIVKSKASRKPDSEAANMLCYKSVTFLTWHIMHLMYRLFYYFAQVETRQGVDRFDRTQRQRSLHYTTHVLHRH